MNNTKTKNHSYGIGYGFSSILVAFVVICLVSFASLSLTSANADLNLSQKLSLRTQAYYNACNVREEYLASTDFQLRNIYDSSTSESDFIKQIDSSDIKNSCIVPIDENEQLEIQLEFIYSDSALYKITR